MNCSGLAENEFLGSGSFSNVYKVTFNNQVYALKKIHHYLLKDSSKRNAILKEISIMKDLDHPSIIKFYDLIDPSETEINLLLEYAQNGNLYTQMKTHERLSESQTITYIKDIASAIRYLHSRPYPILHRDIKPENILLTKEGKCKLADFGSSNTLDEQRYTFVGTKEYMAPQIIKNESYGKEVDLWCLGVLIYEMLTGTLPKHENDRVVFPLTLSRPAEDVIKRLLHVEPALRMTLQELEDHVWLAVSSVIPLLDAKLPSIPSQRITAMQRLMKLKELNQNSIKPSLPNIQLSESVQTTQKHKINETKISESSARNLEQIQYLAELKISLEKQKKLIMAGLNDYQSTKMNKITQLYRLTEKISEYDNNIETLLKKYPLKFSYQFQETVKGFMKKVDHLQQYVEYFPTKLAEETTQIPEINVQKDKRPSLDMEILKLRTYMLNCQKDCLTELIKAKRKQKMLLESNQ